MNSLVPVSFVHVHVGSVFHLPPLATSLVLTLPSPQTAISVVIGLFLSLVSTIVHVPITSAFGVPITEWDFTIDWTSDKPFEWPTDPSTGFKFGVNPYTNKTFTKEEKVYTYDEGVKDPYNQTIDIPVKKPALEDPFIGQPEADCIGKWKFAADGIFTTGEIKLDGNGKVSYKPNGKPYGDSEGGWTIKDDELTVKFNKFDIVMVKDPITGGWVDKDETKGTSTFFEPELEHVTLEETRIIGKW